MYVREKIYQPHELGLGGIWNDLWGGAKKVAGVGLDLAKKGAQGGGGGSTVPTTYVQEPSFLDRYGTPLLLLGAGGAAYYFLKKRK